MINVPIGNLGITKAAANERLTHFGVPMVSILLGYLPEETLRSDEKGHGTERPVRLPDRPHYLQLKQQARPVLVSRH